MPDPVFQLVYLSAAQPSLGLSELRGLLERARQKNARLGITGLLVHHEGSFLQLLEGPEPAVRALFDDVISRDPRHHRVIRLMAATAPARSFSEWTMGFVEPHPALALASLPGFNDFFQRGFTFTGYTPELETKVRDLFQQFRIGRWRQAVAS